MINLQLKQKKDWDDYRMKNDLFEKFGKEYKRGEIIFSEFEPGNSFFVIKEGQVKVTKIVDNNEKTLDVFEPGDIFGEMAIIENRPRSATVEAITFVKLLEFKKENFTTLLQSNPVWGVKLIKSFAKRIYEAKRRVRILLLEEPEMRVMDTFCMLAECRGIERNNFDPVEFLETEESIANWASIEDEDARIILNILEKNNKIFIKNNKIIVKNINEFYRTIDNKIHLIKRMEDKG